MTNEKTINQLKDMQSRCTNGYDAEAINISIKALEEQDRPTGKWISNCVGYYDGLSCSVCGEMLPCSDEYYYDANYCSHCGAKMK